jgi:hypothetical protein
VINDVFGDVFQEAFLGVFSLLNPRIIIDFCSQQQTFAELCITETLACLEATNTKVHCDG